MKTIWNKFNAHSSGELIEAYKKSKPIYRQTNSGEIETTKFEETKGFVYGWGSAFGDENDRVLLMVSHPELFSIEEPVVLPIDSY